MSSSGIYVHRRSAFGILLSDPNIRKFMSDLSSIPTAGEELFFAQGAKHYVHYQKAFLEAGEATYERTLAYKRKRNEAAKNDDDDEENVRRPTEEPREYSHKAEDMIEVQEIDLYLLALLANTNNTNARMQAVGAEVWNHEFPLGETEGTLFDYIPEEDMPKHVRSKKLTVFRLLKMLEGIIFLSWRPENEGFLMIDNTSRFWKALLSNVNFFKYPVPKPMTAIRWGLDDGKFVEAAVCHTHDIVRTFMTVRKKCCDTWNAVGDDAF